MYSLQGMCDLFLLFFACCRVTVRDGEKMEIGTIFEHSVILASCSTDLYGIQSCYKIDLFFQFLLDISSIHHEKAMLPEDKVGIISLPLMTVEIQVW